MPRPTDGYKNAAGLPIPGTHDPISRFMDGTALKFWAWKMGKEGKNLFDRTALDIGTCVHTMIELDLKGRPDADIQFFVEQTIKDPDDLAKAKASFKAWRALDIKSRLKIIAQETPLISEKHQYGGTPDMIGDIGQGPALFDFKTSAKGDVYPDKLVALAAHGKLWNENHPDRPLTGGYHLIMLPKDGSNVRPYHYPDLKPQWKLFKLYLKAFHLDKACSDKKVLKGAAAPVKTSAKPTIPEVEAPSIAPTESKPKVRVKAQQSAPLTLAEMLRAYKHVPEVTA